MPALCAGRRPVSGSSVYADKTNHIWERRPILRDRVVFGLFAGFSGGRGGWRGVRF